MVEGQKSVRGTKIWDHTQSLDETVTIFAIPNFTSGEIFDIRTRIMEQNLPTPQTHFPTQTCLLWPYRVCLATVKQYLINQIFHHTNQLYPEGVLNIK